MKIPETDISAVTAQSNMRPYNCGAFWVANSITSTVLGEVGRELQEQAQERNQEFQMQMERAKMITEKEKLQEEIAYKRRLLELSRQHQQKEAITSFNAKIKAIQLRAYLQYCWPLDPSLPYVVLKEIENNDAPLHPHLNVILMHSQLLPMLSPGRISDKDAKLHEQLEYYINQDMPDIRDIKFRKDAAKGSMAINGSNAHIMNIYFLMGQLPTLVIAPYYNEGKMYFNGAVWEPYPARPLIRPILSFDYDPVQAANREDYLVQKLKLFHAAVSVVAGSVRDSYMLLTQGKAPTMPIWLNDDQHEKMKQLVMGEESIKKFVRDENNGMLTVLDKNKTPGLLDVYSEEDVVNMREQIKANNQNTI